MVAETQHVAFGQHGAIDSRLGEQEEIGFAKCIVASGPQQATFGTSLANRAAHDTGAGPAAGPLTDLFSNGTSQSKQPTREHCPKKASGCGRWQMLLKLAH